MLISPMRRVNELVSNDIGNYLTNKKTWGDIIANVKSYGAKGDGITNDTIAIQSAINSGLPVVIPNGDFLVSGINLINNSKIIGYGRLVSDGTKDLITGTNVTNVELSLRIKGNNSTNYGIRITGSDHIYIHGCEIDGFGAAAGIDFHGGISIDTSSHIRIIQNKIVNGQGVTAADIGIGTCSYVSITENMCLSPCSEGITIQQTPVNKVKYIISNNICTGHARHGILAVYDEGKIAEATITGNICIDNGWTGIYCIGVNGSTPEGNSGEVAITSNVIIACGGTETTTLLTGGIFVAGKLGYIVSNNIIINTGRDLSGATRTYNSYGIRLGLISQNMIISNNFIKNTNGSGIGVLGQKLDNLIIQGNNVIDSLVQQMYVQVSSNNTATGISILNNHFKCIDVDGSGIYLDVSGASSGYRNFRMSENVMVGLKLGTSKFGIRYRASNISNAKFVDNTFVAWDTGLLFDTNQGHLGIGKNIVINRNMFDNNTLAVSLSVTSTIWALIGENKFTNNTTEISNTNYIRYGKFINYAEFEGTAAPSFGNWTIGDRVINTSPTAGGFIGFVCVVGDGTSLGTWKGYGAIQA